MNQSDGNYVQEDSKPILVMYRATEPLASSASHTNLKLNES